MPHGIQVSERYLLRDGRPWLPVMGEYHFARDRRDRWARELRKMKAGGVNIVASYILWIAHEECEGVFRWDAERDLRAFVKAAAEVGLDVILRVGPWAHGETRNGGFPDWVQALPIDLRTNDPRYMALVQRFFAQVAAQVDGLWHSAEHPDGPIIGVQIENELYNEPDHLAGLRSIAESVGMRATLWTATGWGGARLPTGRFLPVYAGYADGFWEESDVEWPEFGRQHFMFADVRDDLSVGADLRDEPLPFAGGATGAGDLWPYATCELGGGMATAYHRRPHVDPEDVVALALTKIGSGSAWQGYYMYHGGRHLRGQLSTTQESHATGYPNDVPVLDYDFAAPIGAEGEQRAHFHKLRRQHLLLRTYGDRLAATEAFIPPATDGRVRCALRGARDNGFLFVNNHQPALAPLPPVADVQFELTGDMTVTLPRQPVTIASGQHFVWPVRQRLGGVPSVTATAEPITEMFADGRWIVLMAESPGIDVELHIEAVDRRSVLGGQVVAESDEGVVVRPVSRPGLGCEILIGDTVFVILDSQTADAVWRGDVGGRDRIVVWPRGGWFDDGFHALAADSDAAIEVFPALDSDWVRLPGEGSVFARYAVPGMSRVREPTAPTFECRPLAPVRRGGSAGRLSAPTDADFAHAAQVQLRIPADALSDCDIAMLEIDWLGDVLRVSLGDELLVDQFWHGRPLQLDLAPLRDRLADEPLTLSAFAWNPDAGIHVDPRFRPQTDEPVLEIIKVTLRAISAVVVR